MSLLKELRNKDTGILSWGKETETHKYLKKFNENQTHIANQKLMDEGKLVHHTFNPYPSVMIKNPYNIDDNHHMMLIYEFNVLDKYGEMHLHFNDTIFFNSNPRNEVGIETTINPTYWWYSSFPMFYQKWRIRTYTLDQNFNLNVHSDYIFDESGRNVFIWIDADDETQARAWIESCERYQTKRNCQVWLKLEIKNDRLKGGQVHRAKVSDELYKEFEGTFKFVLDENDVPHRYKTYIIAKGSKKLWGYGKHGEFGFWSPENKYLGEDGIGFNALCNTLIYSCLNPRDPNVLTNKQISDDILGLSEDWDLMDIS